MGEIKSTMELIMERTKDMKMTEDEKREFKKQEVSGKVRGFIQKFIDGIIDFNNLKKEFAALSRNRHDVFIESVLEESIHRVKPGEDNSLILKIFEAAEGIDPLPVKEVIAIFEQKVEDNMVEMEKALSLKLSQRGIEGTAVLPNIEADPEWLVYLSTESKELEKNLHGRINKNQRITR